MLFLFAASSLFPRGPAAKPAGVLSLGLIASLGLGGCTRHVPIDASSSPPERGLLVDRVVSTVNDKVITATELRMEELIMEWDTSPIPPFEQMDDVLARVEERWILKELAGNIKVFHPDERQLKARMDRFEERFSQSSDYWNFLAMLGMSQAELQRILEAWMTAEAYVHRNVGLPLLSDPEAQGAGFQELYMERYGIWIQQVRDRAQVRRVPLMEAQP